MRPLSASLLFFLPFSIAAPQQSSAPQIRIQVDLVNIEATVTDPAGNFVPGLTKDRFRILDDGVPQPITHFASVHAPARILLLIETSPAVYLIHRQHLEAASALLSGLAADDSVALATYADRLTPLIPFTSDKAALAAAVPRLRYNLGMAQLDLLASLSVALDQLDRLPGRKAIVLLTTGLDPSPPALWQQFESRLAASNVVIVPVALGSDLRYPESEDSDKKKKKNQPPPSIDPAAVAKEFAEADRLLRALASSTGGTAFFPRSARDFPAIYKQVAALLRHQYSLGIAPSARDARVHSLEVQLLAPDGSLLASSASVPRSSFTSDASTVSVPPPLPASPAPSRTQRSASRNSSGRPSSASDSPPAFRIRARPSYLAPSR